MKRTVITLANLKGGVGKSTSAIHVARYLQLYHGPTTLIDSDRLGTCRRWDGGKDRLGFPVVKPGDGAETPFVVVDTAAHPSDNEIAAFDAGSDLLIIPCQPTDADFDATAQFFLEYKPRNAVALITMTGARTSPVEKENRKLFRRLQIPVFASRIRRYAAYDAAMRSNTTVDQLPRYVRSQSAVQAWGDYRMLGEEMMK